MTDKRKDQQNPSVPTPLSESFESYHQRNCKICRHPDRPAIEYDFLHWRSPDHIARDYNFSWRSLYRHAHAAGLFEQRKRNLRSSLEFLIEGASRVTPSAHGVLRAVELYARMNDSGELIDVPKTQIIVIAKDGAPITLPAVTGLKIDHNSPATMQLAPPNAAMLTEFAPERATQRPLETDPHHVPQSERPFASPVADRELNCAEPEAHLAAAFQPVNPIQTEFDVSP